MSKIPSDTQWTDLAHRIKEKANSSDLATKADAATTYTKTEVDTALAGKQGTLTAGNNITISGTTISAADTTYSNFTGTDGTAGGTQGLVPAPTASDADKYLKSDGTWGEVDTGPTVVQTTGTSTTDVMSQNAITSIIGDIESALNTINNGGSA